VRNNGGGHLNHTVHGSESSGEQPTGAIAPENQQTFGSLMPLKNSLTKLVAIASVVVGLVGT